MRSEWIEDLLTLVQHPNFSQAAAARCVTQPAFSRRIQMLETWVGAELIDRRARPLRLTPAGERHAHEFREILNRLETLRAKIRSDASGIVEFRMATQHSLAITRLPSLIEALAQHMDEYRVEIAIRSNARDDCVDQFTRGEVDLMLCLEESDNLLKNRLPWAGRLPVGSEALVPVSAADANGRPRHVPKKGGHLRLIGSPRNSFAGRLVAERIEPLLQPYHAEVVHESTFLAGVREMVLAGLGVAWLPSSLVMGEVKRARLAIVRHGLPAIPLELGLYHRLDQANVEALKLVWSLLVSSNARIAGTR